jgi:hypothetical protein
MYHVAVLPAAEPAPANWRDPLVNVLLAHIIFVKLTPAIGLAMPESVAVMLPAAKFQSECVRFCDCVTRDSSMSAPRTASVTGS